MNIAIDTSPLRSGHSNRGIGHYTRYLLSALEKFYPDLHILKDTTSGADIVHYPYFDLYFLTLPIKKPKPTIVVIHDAIPLVFLDKFPSGIKGKIKLHVQKFSLGSTKAIITVSHHSKTDIVKYLGVPADKIHVIHLAVDEKFQPVDERVKQAIKQKYDLPDSFFLYVGDVNYNKNIPRLVEAFARLPDDRAHLVLAGKAFENKSLPEVQTIEQATQESGKSSYVHTIGFVPDEDVVALYNLATAYVQPSLYEGFGLPVLEAMQCGTPVISSDTSSLKEIIGDAAFVIDPHSSDSITRAFEKILSDDALRQNLGQRGLVQAAKFSQKEFADQTVQVYEKVYEQFCRNKQV